MAKKQGSRVLREFEMCRFLGKGYFGTVVEVKHRLDTKKYAIKLDFAADSLTFKEVKNFSKIPAHDNVVTYVTAWEDILAKEEVDKLLKLIKCSPRDLRILPGCIQTHLLCIQMELCGQSLRHWLAQHKSVDVNKSQNLFVQLLNGLQHVHDQNLIHRDLKPDNIFFHLNDANRIKIGDFGIAVSHHGTAGANHTRGFGDAYYLAPEQNTSNYNKKADLYAMGMILFELYHPPVQQDIFSSLTHLRNTKYLPTEFKAWPEISRTILSLLETNANKRPTIKVLISRMSASKPIFNRTASSASSVRHQVKCNGCGVKNIIGIRYKCNACVDFNLCEKCESKPGIHPPCHFLLKIRVINHDSCKLHA